MLLSPGERVDDSNPPPMSGQRRETRPGPRIRIDCQNFSVHGNRTGREWYFQAVGNF